MCNVGPGPDINVTPILKLPVFQKPFLQTCFLKVETKIGSQIPNSKIWNLNHFHVILVKIKQLKDFSVQNTFLNWFLIKFLLISWEVQEFSFIFYVNRRKFRYKLQKLGLQSSLASKSHLQMRIFQKIALSWLGAVHIWRQMILALFWPPLPPRQIFC